MSYLTRDLSTLGGEEAEELAIDVRYASLGMKLLGPVDRGSFDRHTKRLARALELWATELEQRQRTAWDDKHCDVAWREMGDAANVAREYHGADMQKMHSSAAPEAPAQLTWVKRIADLLPPHVRDLVSR